MTSGARLRIDGGAAKGVCPQRATFKPANASAGVKIIHAVGVQVPVLIGSATFHKDPEIRCHPIQSDREIISSKTKSLFCATAKSGS
jgi:hypothetical protein